MMTFNEILNEIYNIIRDIIAHTNRYPILDIRMKIKNELIK